MRCAIHTCGWLCWLGIKVSISGERVVGGYNTNETSRSAPKPPLPRTPRSGCFEAGSALHYPLSTNWTLTRALSAYHPHERDTFISTSDIDTTWAFGRVFFLFILFHKRHLCRCFMSRWGKICWRRKCQIEIAWQHPQPPHPLIPAADVRMFEAGTCICCLVKMSL